MLWSFESRRAILPGRTLPGTTEWPLAAARSSSSSAVVPGKRPRPRTRTRTKDADERTARPGKSSRGGRSGAFTLIEVILAIFIATGMLTTVLFFYHQAADLRNQLLAEAEQIDSIRLLLDRLTTDLRCAQCDYVLGYEFSGDATSIRFVTTGLPSISAWQNLELGRAPRPETDLRWVTYAAAVQSAPDETNLVVTGFNRLEELLVEEQTLESDWDLFWMTGDEFALLEDGSASADEPLTDAIHFVRFRFWDGANWLDRWDDLDLPRGVEVTFGREPLPEELTVDEYPYEQFRRVISLPGSHSVETAASIEDFLDEFFLMEEAP